jgi:hypothetical protein
MITRTSVKRLIATILAMFFLALCFTNEAAAAEKYTTNSTKLSANKWGTAKRYERYYNYKYDDYENKYKMLEIKVPKDGYVTLKTNNTSEICIATARKNKNPKILYKLSGSKKYLRPIKAGSYYIFSSFSDVKVQYSATKVATAKNTTKAKSKILKANTGEIIALYDNKKATRWYKITLTKKQYVNITLKLLDKTDYITSKGFKLYDAKNNLIYENIYLYSATNKCKTDEKLAAGTYYLKIEIPKDNEYLSKLMQISWK